MNLAYGLIVGLVVLGGLIAILNAISIDAGPPRGLDSPRGPRPTPRPPADDEDLGPVNYDG